MRETAKAACAPKRHTSAAKRAEIDCFRRTERRDPRATPRSDDWPGVGSKDLLDLDLGACRFELLLDVLGLVLADAFFDGLGRAFDQVLRLFQAEARDFTNDLDRVDLVRTGVRQDHVEFRLLLGGCSGRRTTASGSNGNRSGTHAPFRLELFDELRDLDDGELGKVIDDLIFRNFSHDNLHWVPASW